MMVKKPLTEKQIEALDLDHDGNAGGSLPQASTDRHDAGYEYLDSLKSGLSPEGIKPPEPPELVAVEAMAGPGEPLIPTVGSIVHYYANRQDGPYAAIVTGANGDLVNLMVFHKAFSLPRTDVPHLSGLEGSGWFWVGFWEAVEG